MLHWAGEHRWHLTTCSSYNTKSVYVSHHCNQILNLNTPHGQSKQRHHHRLQQAAWWMSFQINASTTFSIHHNAVGPTVSCYSWHCEGGKNEIPLTNTDKQPHILIFFAFIMKQQHRAGKNPAVNVLYHFLY